MQVSRSIHYMLGTCMLLAKVHNYMVYIWTIYGPYFGPYMVHIYGPQL